MFLAFAVATKLLTTFYIPVMGTNGIKVSFGGIFTAFPAFLFGPIYGGAVCALSDILGHFAAPKGPYIFWYTLTAFIAGYLKGLIFSFLSKKSENKMRIILVIVLTLLCIFGIVTMTGVINDGITDKLIATKDSVMSREQINILSGEKELSFGTKFIMMLSQYSKDSAFPGKFATYYNLVSAGLIIFSLIGILIVLAENTVSKVILKKGSDDSLKILLSVLTAGIINTTINTQIILKTTASLSGRSFLLFWVPRVAEEIVVCIIQACIITFLYEIYKTKILIPKKNAAFQDKNQASPEMPANSDNTGEIIAEESPAKSETSAEENISEESPSSSGTVPQNSSEESKNT